LFEYLKYFNFCRGTAKIALFYALRATLLQMSKRFSCTSWNSSTGYLVLPEHGISMPLTNASDEEVSA
jgi:hypothetical protein